MSTRLSFALAVLALAACGAQPATKKCGSRQCASTQRCDLETQLCVQNSPPVVVFNPVPGVATGPTQRLTGRATDDERVERVEVSVDDGLSWSQAALDEGNFSVIVELPALDLKALSVKGRAFDSLGQRGEVTDSFRVDDVGPAATLRSPQQAVRGPQVALELDVTDGSGVEAVTADFGDGRPLDATFDGAVWKVSGPVPAGDGVPRSIAVKAIDAVGNASTSAVSVTVDDLGPRGAFASPAAGALVTGATLRVSGAVSDGTGVGSVRVALDGAATGVDATVTGVTWSASLPLPQENGVQHDLVATFTDLLGNASEVRVTVTIDNVAPQPTLVDPAPDVYVYDPQLRVRVLAIGGASSVSVSLGTQPPVNAVAQGADLWVAMLPVPMEDYTPETLSVVATDVAGNRGLATRTVQVDRVVPVVRIGSPVAAQKLNAADFAGTDAVTVSFTATDGDPQLTIEGFDGTAWRTGSSFTITTSPTDNPRVYPVQARATDRAGNVTSISWSFSVDRVAPRASITPANGTRNVEPRQAMVSFTEPVYGPTTLTEPLTLTPVASAPGAWSADHASFATATLAPYTVYQADLLAGLADDSGNPVAAAAPVRFHTAAAMPGSGTILATGVQDFEASSNQDGVLLVALDRGNPSAQSWSAFAWDPATGAQQPADLVPNGQATSTAFHVLASRIAYPDLSAGSVNEVSYTNLGGTFTQFTLNGVPQANSRSIAIVPTPPMSTDGVDGTAFFGFIDNQGLYTRDPSVSVPLNAVPQALSSGSWRWTAWGQNASQTLTLDEYGCGFSLVAGASVCGHVSRTLPSTSWDASAVVSPSGGCQVASTASASGRLMTTSTWSCLRGCGSTALATRAAPGDGLRLAPFAGNNEDAVLGAWRLPGAPGVQLGKLAASACGGSFVPVGPSVQGSISRFRPVQLGNKPALLYIDTAGNLKVYVP